MAKLEPIPEDKVLSTYELGRVLEDVAKALKNLPLSVIRNVEDEEQVAYQNIESIIKGVNNRLVKLEESLTESENSLVAAGDEHYHKTEKALKELRERLSKLPPLEAPLQIPYGAKDLIETAERLSRLDDQQWNRLIDLVKALKK